MANIRERYFNLFDNNRTNFDINFMELPPSAKLQFLIGDIGYLFSIDIGLFYDNYGMMFLKDCFKTRGEILKDL